MNKRIKITIIAVIVMLSYILPSFRQISSAPSSFAGEAAVDYTEGYGYTALNTAMRTLYDDLVEDISAFAAGATDVTGDIRTDEYGNRMLCIPGLAYMRADYKLSYNEMLAVYTTLRLFHPEFFFLPGTVRHDDAYSRIELMLSEEFAGSEARKAAQDGIKSVAALYLAAIPKGTGNAGVALALHDKMLAELEYAYEDEENKIPERTLRAHSIIGAALDKRGTCEAYAMWFSYLMLQAGIENYLITGLSLGQSHMWNIVKLDDGKWYLFDVTWDDITDSGHEHENENYLYFASPSSVFAKSHTANTDKSDGFSYQFRVPEAEDSFVFNGYTLKGELPDYSDKTALQSAYTVLWLEALSKSDKTVVMYAPRESDRTALEAVIEETGALTEVLKDAGYLIGSMKISYTKTENGVYTINGVNTYDINSDGRLDNEDVLIIMRFLAGDKQDYDISPLNADVNKDGRVDMKDVVCLMRRDI